MKKYLSISLACTLFISSSAFVFLQEQEKQQEKQDESKVKPLRIPDSSKYDDLVKQVNILTKELAESKRKDDSLSTELQKNTTSDAKRIADLREANVQYRRSLNRLKFILEKFPPDSVMKFYGQYKDPEESAPDTVKKKTETALVLPTQRKRGFLRRIFGKNK